MNIDVKCSIIEASSNELLYIDPNLVQLDRKNPKRHYVSNRNCNQSQIPLFRYIDLSNKSGLP